MDSNMAAWAKANPALAKKVKKGQSGYAAIQKALGNAPAAPKSTGAFKPGGTSKFPAGRTSTNKPQTGTNANPFKPSGSSTFPTRSSSVLKPAGKVPATAKPSTARQGVTKGIGAAKRADAKNQVLKGVKQAAKADKSLPKKSLTGNKYSDFNGVKKNPTKGSSKKFPLKSGLKMTSDKMKKRGHRTPFH
tara:strand:+ start:89 stop:658 length:570 start_codon:yes stop_codon:yes gene_type:complete